MKVKQLRKILEELPDDTEVILQKDSEGNGYSPLAGADGNAVYVSETTWSGEVYSVDESAEDMCMDEEEWAALRKKPRCLVLYPIN